MGGYILYPSIARSLICNSDDLFHAIYMCTNQRWHKKYSVISPNEELHTLNALAIMCLCRRLMDHTHCEAVLGRLTSKHYITKN